MSSINKSLKLTVEVEEEYPNGYIPPLDTKVRLICSRVKYAFFEKSMNNKYCILPNSAMDWGQKRTLIHKKYIED